MNTLRVCAVVALATLSLAAPAAAASSTQCPQSTAGGPHPDAQRAGQIFAQWHVQLPPSVGDQYSGHGVDNARGTWFVGYAPGPLDEAAVRARVLEVVDRNASPEDAAWMRDRLTLDPQRYSEAELRDVQRQLVEQSGGGRFGNGWSAGVSCRYGDVKRAELILYEGATTPEQQEEARRAAAPFGDRALVAVEPGPGPGPAQAPVCPLVAPVPPPVEGSGGFVFVDQECRAGERVEDYEAVTDFGDGTREATPIRPDGLWLLGGRHTYRRAGRYRVVTALTHRPTGTTSYFPRTVVIENAPLRRRAVARPSFPAGRAARRVVAAFIDGNRLARAADHRATVRWGDGTRSKGTVRRVAAGRFEVLARHRYTGGALPRRIIVRIADDRGAKLTVRTALARAR